MWIFFCGEREQPRRPSVDWTWKGNKWENVNSSVEFNNLFVFLASVVRVSLWNWFTIVLEHGNMFAFFSPSPLAMLPPVSFIILGFFLLHARLFDAARSSPNLKSKAIKRIALKAQERRKRTRFLPESAAKSDYWHFDSARWISRCMLQA